MAQRRGRVLWLVRSGETAWEREERIQGAADLPLAPGAAAAVSAELAALDGRGVAAVHHPADDGATETARLVARAFRARSRVRNELADPHLGLLEGLEESVLAERYPTRRKQWISDPLALVPPDGEPLHAARDRVLTALERLITRSRGAELAVVLHPLALGLVRCTLADAPAAAMWSLLDQRGVVERYVLPADAPARIRASTERG